MLVQPSVHSAEAFFESTPALLCIADVDGRFLRLNPAWERVLGFPLNELVGRRYLDFVHPDDVGLTIAAMSELAAGRSVRAVRNRYLTRTGDWVVLTWVAAAERGGLIHAVAWDVTEQAGHDLEAQGRLDAGDVRSAQLQRMVASRTAELQRANAELEAFAYSVSHDLRTPLRALDGYSQALLEDWGDRLDDQARHYLGRIRTASQRMASLIDDLLTLSRVTRGPLRRNRVDVSALCVAIVEELRALDPDRDVAIHIEGGLHLFGDARLLRLAFVNLLANAWKFTVPTAAAEIRVEAVQGGDGSGRDVIAIRDNGVGFDMRYAGRLFQAFNRLHPQSDFPGTGVGLATVSRVAQRHDGTVWADASPSAGASFFLALPRIQEETVDDDAG